GRPAEGARLYESVWERQVKKLGPDHPFTLNTRHNLATAYLASGRGAEALAIYQQVLEQQSKTLGPDHPFTLNTMHDMAGEDLARNHPPASVAESIKLLEQVRERRLKKLGPDHPDTLNTLHSLGVGYQQAGRTEEALAVFEQVLEIQ